MIVSELKKSILQIATEGKLVEQNLKFSSKEELQLILKDVKDNKKYKYEAIENVPFFIPENWIWVKLEDLCTKITDGTHSTPKYTKEGIHFLSVKDISSGKLNFENTKYISKEEHNQLYSRCNPEFGDVLITKVGTTGVPAIVDTDKEFSLFVSVALLKINIDKIYNKFLVYFLNSPIVQKQVRENTRGIGNKNWVLDDIKSTILPLPPLEEQKRIVKKLDEIFEKLDEINPVEIELEKLKEEFPNNMRNAFLNDIFKNYTDRIELKNIANINGGYAFKSVNYKKDGTGVRVIRISDFDESGIKSENIVRYDYEPKLDTYEINNDDIIMCMTGGTVGKNIIVRNLEERSYSNQRVATIKVNENFLPKFIYYYINSPEVQLLINKSKNSTNDNISMDLIKEFRIPDISIGEQKKIINKIEKILPLIENIKTIYE